MSIGMTLIGAGGGELLPLIAAVDRLGRRGIRPGGARFTLEEVRDGAGRVVFRPEDGLGGYRLPHIRTPGGARRPLPDRAEVLEVRFLTPTHLRRESGPLARLVFRDVVLRAAERVQRLATEHCGAPPSESRGWLPPGLFELAGQVRTIRDATTPADTTAAVGRMRRSSRQCRDIPLGGRLGLLWFAGPWQPFWPLLCVVAELGLGHNTVIGDGRITVRALHSPAGAGSSTEPAEVC